MRTRPNAVRGNKAELKDEQLAHLRRIAPLGGRARRAYYSGTELTDKARAAYAASFRAGHVGCSLCPDIVFPSSLTDAERDARARAARSLHLSRVARLPRPKSPGRGK